MKYLARGRCACLCFSSCLSSDLKARFGGACSRFRIFAPPIIPTPEAENRLEVVATLPVAPAMSPYPRAAACSLRSTRGPTRRRQARRAGRWAAGGVSQCCAARDGGGAAALDTPLGVRIDGQDRLWVIDHGFHGLRQPRLWAIDIKTRTVVHQVDLPRSVAGPGSFPAGSCGRCRWPKGLHRRCQRRRGPASHCGL